MKAKVILISLLFLSLCAQAKTWQQTEHGARATIGSTNIELQFFTPQTVRIIKTPADSKRQTPMSLSVIAEPSAISVSIRESKSATAISSPQLTVIVDNKTGLLSFRNHKGALLTKESSAPIFTDYDDCGTPAYAISQTFAVAKNEHLYGLGSLDNQALSRRNYSKLLEPDNTEDGFPVIQSSKGYGIVWDNYSPTQFTDNQQGMTFASQVGDAIDYYFIFGGSADGVIAQMRRLSGQAPMFPLWSYGFWQSRERYKTQNEPVAVIKKYRELNIPIDGIIQDWQYWGNNYLWNAMEFLAPGFKRPQQMVDSLHNLNAKLIVSVWSAFGPHTKPFAELEDKGFLFDFITWPESGLEFWPPRLDYPSGAKVYNAYNPEARDIYWKHLSGLRHFGIDGWWMDSTEPDYKRGSIDFQTGMGSYRKVKGAYPLLTVGGVNDHQQAEEMQKDAENQKRIFILTRSAWFGQQRYGCHIWTGDVISTWDVLRSQIPQHLNFTMSGNPHLNSDLGGFYCGRYNLKDGRKACQNPLFAELATRWMQLGVFTPMMRQHGTDSPREIHYFGQAGEPVYDAMVSAIKLRYSLLPYIYSTAWDVTANSGSFMRPLVMDFPGDEASLTANDRFMFGRQLLVAPIVKALYTDEATTKPEKDKTFDFNEIKEIQVQLPTGTDWFNFFTTEKFHGGKTITLPANLQTIPLFAKAGAIIPIGPDVNFAEEKPWDNLTIKVFPGADGSFELYEDEFDNYNYLNGAFSTIPFSFDAKTGRLTIGDRAGSYPGMLETRQFTIENAITGRRQTIPYAGRSITLLL